MLNFFQSLPIFLSALLFLFVVIGIYRCKNTLEILHFATIIDVICLPLMFVGIICVLGFQNTRIICISLLMVIISPITSYFLGTLYYKNNAFNNVVTKSLNVNSLINFEDDGHTKLNKNTTTDITDNYLRLGSNYLDTNNGS